MICKFFRGGRTYSGAKSAVAYLLNERVEQGQAKVIQGNPDITLNIIKHIKNKWKFSSGVMSFEELLDDKTKKEIIEEFKKTFFAGLDEEQYNLLIVEHTDKGRTELHFIIPRIELTTGKAFNSFWHKRDFKKKDLFQDYINAKFNLASPHEVDRQRIIKQPNPNWKKQELQEWIDKYITENIEQGLIQNSEDVRYFLEQAGFTINRQGKDYIGLELEGKKIRMKGAIYGKNFTSIAELARTAEERERKHIPLTREEFRELERKLTNTIQEQAKRNREKYKQADRRQLERADRGMAQGNENSNIHAIGGNVNSRNNRYSGLLAEERAGGDLQEQLHIAEARVELWTNERVGMVFKEQKQKRRVNDRAGATINRVIRAGEARKRKREERTERYAKRTKQTNREAEQLTRAGFDAVTGLEQAIARRKARMERIRAIRKAIERNTRRLKELAMQELERFKREANIAEVAQVFGYYIDKEKSSRAVKQLRNDQTGDKIVVSRNEANEHYIYFSMRNEQDNGTIIDFLQERTGKNLGQVRVWLRKWLKGDIERNRVQKIAIAPSSANRPKIQNVWDKIENVSFPSSWRGISVYIWDELMESGKVKITQEAIYYKLMDLDGLCGIEKRGFDGEKRIISGSEKGLWSYGNLKEAKEIVIAESPLDALSYKILSGREDIYLLATMGAIGEKQKEILRAVLDKAKDKEITIASDNDLAGEFIAQEIKEICKEVGAAKLYRAAPQKSKDWNEELQKVRKRSSHSCEMSL